MRWLPALVVGRERWVLPMADASAVAMAQWLLVGAPSDCQLLAGILVMDPPLALWAACAADRAGAEPPDSLDGLAAWLAEHALEVLQWQAGQFTEFSADAPWIEDCADRVAIAVEVAELAAALGAGQGHDVASQAALLGLLHDAVGWIGCDSPLSEVGIRLPQWLTHPATPSRETAAADLATQIILGKAVAPDTADVDLAAYRDRGRAARERWLATADLPAQWLPALTAKLARLAALERHFEETVETEKLEAMAEFAAGAGHEINNPLAVIAGRAQLMLRDEAAPERRRSLALMNAQAMRVYEMIADMRLFARPPQPEVSRFDVVELADRVINELAPLAAQQETSLVRRGDCGPVEIEADPVQMAVALRSLCQNALEVLGHRGNVEITIRRVGQGIELVVSDDGPGISPEQRRHIFDPYYSARQAGRGLGMGLSKCWRIVTGHGGRISVDSGPGRGAVFTIQLPN